MTAPTDAEESPALTLFWELWRQEKFFECHEVLEELWRQRRGPKRLFYNGLIHCAVAIYQHRRGNFWGASRQLLRAQIKLEALRPRFENVDINGLLHTVELEIAPSLAQLNDEQRAQLLELEASIRTRIEQQQKQFSEEVL